MLLRIPLLQLTAYFPIIMVSKSRILKKDITDLFPLFYINCGKCPNVIVDECKLIRTINEARSMQYMSKIHNMDWSFLGSFWQCQSFPSNFLRVIRKIHDEPFPLTRLKIWYINPWWLKTSIKHMNKLYLAPIKHPILYSISTKKQYKKESISLLEIEGTHFLLF